MSLLGKKDSQKPKKSVFLHSNPQIVSDPVNYNSVVDWLTGLSEEDYERVLKVAKIYREANANVSAALGVENAPTTFIKPPKTDPLNLQAPGDFLLDEDIDSAFLDEAAADSARSKEKGKSAGK